MSLQEYLVLLPGELGSVPVEFNKELFLTLSEGGLTHAEICDVMGLSVRRLYRIKQTTDIVTTKRYNVPTHVKEAVKAAGCETMAVLRAEAARRMQETATRRAEAARRAQEERDRAKELAFSVEQKNRRVTLRRLVIYDWLTNANRLTRTGYKPARLDRSHIDKRRLTLMGKTRMTTDKAASVLGYNAVSIWRQKQKLKKMGL